MSEPRELNKDLNGMPWQRISTIMFLAPKIRWPFPERRSGSPLYNGFCMHVIITYARAQESLSPPLGREVMKFSRASENLGAFKINPFLPSKNGSII